MIGFAPDGLITLISNILNESCISDMCTEYDGIMVGKGFLIEKECPERGLFYTDPIFLAKISNLN